MVSLALRLEGQSRSDVILALTARQAGTHDGTRKWDLPDLAVFTVGRRAHSAASSPQPSQRVYQLI